MTMKMLLLWKFQNYQRFRSSLHSNPKCGVAMESHCNYYTSGCKAIGSAEARAGFGKRDELLARDLSSGLIHPQNVNWLEIVT